MCVSQHVSQGVLSDFFRNILSYPVLLCKKYIISSSPSLKRSICPAAGGRIVFRGREPFFSLMLYAETTMIEAANAWGPLLFIWVRFSFCLRRRSRFKLGITCWQSPPAWLCVCLFHASVQQRMFAFIAGSFFCLEFNDLVRNISSHKQKRERACCGTVHFWTCTFCLMDARGEPVPVTGKPVDRQWKPEQEKWGQHSYKTQLYCSWMHLKLLTSFPQYFTTSSKCSANAHSI